MELNHTYFGLAFSLAGLRLEFGGKMQDPDNRTAFTSTGRGELACKKISAMSMSIVPLVEVLNSIRFHFRLLSKNIDWSIENNTEIVSYVNLDDHTNFCEALWMLIDLEVLTLPFNVRWPLIRILRKWQRGGAWHGFTGTEVKEALFALNQICESLEKECGHE